MTMGSGDEMGSSTPSGGNREKDGESPTRRIIPEGGLSRPLPEMIGKYRVLRLIGRGGMGRVFEAWDESLHRSVAIKLINPELFQHPGAIDRFRREARAAARLNHPNITAVYEFIEDDAQPGIVMEYVEGADLGALLKQRGPFDAASALRVVRDVALALQRATAHQLVHRDIKPSNIALTTGGIAKVMDFGLSKCMDGTSGLTSSGALVGTPDYMSPEQACGEKPDFRADMYSLGCTLFALLAGRRPFDSENIPGLIHKHVNDPLPVPREWDALYGGQLSALIHRMTAKRKEDRFASWDEAIAVMDTMMGTPPPGTPALLPIMTPKVEERKHFEISASIGRKTPSMGCMVSIAFALLLAVVWAPQLILEAQHPARTSVDKVSGWATTTWKVKSVGASPLVSDKPDMTVTEEGTAEAEVTFPLGTPTPAADANGGEWERIRQKAAEESLRGDSAGAQSTLESGLDGNALAPSARTTSQTMIELFRMARRCEERVNADLSDRNPDRELKLGHVRELLSHPAPGVQDKDLWDQVVYLYLLGDPAAPGILGQLRGKRRRFANTREHEDSIRTIEEFFSAAAEFGSAHEPPK